MIVNNQDQQDEAISVENYSSNLRKLLTLKGCPSDALILAPSKVGKTEKQIVFEELNHILSKDKD